MKQINARFHIFCRFLKEHKIYHKFRMYFIPNNSQIIVFFNNTLEEWWITYSFPWGATKEGVSFWQSKSRAWRDYLEISKTRNK